MRDDDIRQLFERISKHFGSNVEEGTEDIFAMLVNTTLKYRDQLDAKTGTPLTIGETREALEAFMHVMKKKSFPENLSERAHDLIVIWLEALKERTQH